MPFVPFKKGDKKDAALKKATKKPTFDLVKAHNKKERKESEKSESREPASLRALEKEA